LYSSAICRVKGIKCFYPGETDMQKLKVPFYIFLPVICMLPFLMGLTCGDGGAAYTYTLTVHGYRGNFEGYYYLDGELETDYYFSGELSSTGISGYSYYYFEIGFNSLSSLDVYVTKDTDYGQVTATIWQDDVKLDSVTSGYHETQDDGTYVASLDELYYESDDSDDDDE